MKTLTNHSSATAREETPHVKQTTRSNTVVNAPVTSGDDLSAERIGPLAEMICRNGEEPAAALLILMAMLENSPDPKALAHTVKHLAFTRCGELNAYGIVDAQIAMLESELLS